jgi:PKD repeat protein
VLAASPSAGPAVAIDNAGDGVAAYGSGHAGSAVAQARGFDATPPSIDSASIPSAATTGQPVQFTAQASDLWGPVVLSWDFGDGSAATSGATATHAFTGRSPQSDGDGHRRGGQQRAGVRLDFRRRDFG